MKTFKVCQNYKVVGRVQAVNATEALKIATAHYGAKCLVVEAVGFNSGTTQ